MNAYFFDSSAIVKRYINESGSIFVENLANLKSGNLIFLSRITQVEVVSAFARRLKGGSISQNDYNNALALFQHDLINNYFVIEVTKAMFDDSMILAAKYVLRAYDAVQLASALEINKERLLQGLSILSFISADNELNNAVKSEGLLVENPNNYP